MTPARASHGIRPLREDHLGASTFIEKGWHGIAHGDFAGAEASLRTALKHGEERSKARALYGRRRADTVRHRVVGSDCTTQLWSQGR